MPASLLLALTAALSLQGLAAYRAATAPVAGAKPAGLPLQLAAWSALPSVFLLCIGALLLPPAPTPELVMLWVLIALILQLLIPLSALLAIASLLARPFPASGWPEFLARASAVPVAVLGWYTLRTMGWPM